MSLRAYLGSLFGVSLLCASSLSHAQCTKDIDCKGERLCEAGQCVDAPAPAATTGAAPPASAPPAATPPTAAAADASVTATAAPQPVETSSAGALAPPSYEPAQDEPRSPGKGKRHSAGMMTAGIVMVAVAPVALLAALLANSKQSSCESAGAHFGTDGLVTYEDNADCGKYDATIYGGAIGGIALLAVGIPLIVVGGKREPATARVSPWATPRAAGFKLSLSL